MADGEQQEISVSYAELDRQARTIAKVLQERGLSSEQVLLLFPPGLEFIAALFGCFYAGAVAVPLAPPNPKRMQDELRRMAALTRDSRARAVLTTQLFHTIFQSLPDADPAFGAIEFILIEDALAEPALAWEPPPITRDRLAFLQYTSGSTGTPKGVMVTHKNLLENAALLMRACENDEDTPIVSWLPMFHDFGLIGCVLQPMFIGSSCTLLSPLAFLQRPVRWLSAISRYRARASGAPNFAFELCVRKIVDEECASLDLGSWRIAPCAAEPIRKDTMERFSQRFARYGFRRTTLWPCYGLAEGTLLSTGGPAGRGTIAYDFSGRALTEGHARIAQPGDRDRRTLVALGNTHQGGVVAIVSPETGVQCPDSEVGEIWLSGPSTTRGYFGRPEETERTFRGTLPSHPGRSFLRTGDLGFLRAGELFVTGRLKDVLIIRGQNHYPQDIEQTAETTSESIRAGCSAAFSVEGPDGEVPVLVAELAAGTDPEAAARIGVAIRQAITEQHGLSLHALCLAPPQSVPKTSSGKLQRSRCRADYLGNKLQPIWQWTAAESTPEIAPVPTPKAEPPIDRAQTALDWLQGRIRELAQTAGLTINPDSPLTSYDLDSAKLVGLSGELGERLGKPLPPTFFFDHPTLSAVTRFLREPMVPAAPLATRQPAEDEPIAIIGMSCRWPGGVQSPSEYWRLLIEGRDAIEPFPTDRWDVDALYDPDPTAAGKTYCKQGGFLRDLDRFDAAFFGIAPREAAAMDPQQRLVLEGVWEALEHARIPPERLSQSQTGVYLGSIGSDYRSSSIDRVFLKSLDGYAATGQASSVLSGRVAYALDLQGSAITVDTACSSSLVALHLACEGLRRRECDLAVAGGVQVMNTPAAFVEFSRLRGLAPDGRCKSFGARADGTSWSEGCGILLLKRLADARRDGDPILALVRGTAVNQDGRSQGLTAPNGPAQERVVRHALARSGLRPEDIDAIEAHGTGTRLGDPVEAGALSAVFGANRDQARPLYLGSSKSNLGHTQAAAGVAGVMKLVLSLVHEVLPRTLHAEEPSPHIAWDGSGLRLLKEAQPWPRSERVRRAGVSSFGISGTNAHVVLEEAPRAEIAPSLSTEHAELVILSARSPQALDAQAQRLRLYLLEHPEHTLAAVASSLALTRSGMEHRMAFAAPHREELLVQLEGAGRGNTPASTLRGYAAPSSVPKVVFVFPGQGSQWLGMGRTLLSEEPAFRRKLEECDRAIQAEAGFSVLKELEADEPASQLNRIEVVQPVLFAMGVALAALWQAWGVRPDAVVGHSLGEVAAAHVGGALSLVDAVAIICRRSKLLRRICGHGEMALVELSAAESEQALTGYQDRLSVAVSNSPRSTVIAGEPGALAQVLSQLETKGVFCRRVKVDVASHSPQVDLLLPELVGALERLAPQKSGVPMLSSVTAERVEGEELGAEYWAQNLRQPVRFAEVVQKLSEEGHGLFVEMSAHPILVPAIQEVIQTAGQNGTGIGSLRREQPERAELLGALGALWAKGYPVDWSQQFPRGAKVELPTYPWQRQRYWLEANAEPGKTQVRTGEAGGHPLLGESIPLSTQDGTQLWESSLDSKRIPWLGDHRVQGALVFPGAGYLEMALAVGNEVQGTEPFVITDMAMFEALGIAPEGSVPVQVVATTEEPGRVRFQVASRHGSRGEPSFRVHARAVLRRSDSVQIPERVDLMALRSRMAEIGSMEAFYSGLARMGLAYGPALHGIRAMWRGEGEALAQLRLPKEAGSRDGYRFHPVLLDACLQAMASCSEELAESVSWVPVGVGMLRMWQQSPADLYCHVKVAPAVEGAMQRRADLIVVDGTGTVVAELRDVVVQQVARRPDSEQDGWYVGIEWQPLPVPTRRITAGRWLLLGDGDGLGDSLREALEGAGHAALHAPAIPEGAAALRELLAQSFHGKAPTAVVHLGSLDLDAEDEAFETALVSGCESVLNTVQAVVGMGYRDAPRLWLLTRAVQAVGEGDVAVLQAPVLGLGRTIEMEHGELRCARLDLDPRRPDAEVSAIVAELLADDSEDEIALRSGERRVARLIRKAPESGPRERQETARCRSFRLETDKPGVLDQLVLRARERRPPGPGEVEIAVETAGLNFLDVLLALGVMPDDRTDGTALELGGECSGRIVAVGEGVQGMSVGDSVMALAAGAFASHVTTPAALVRPRPAGLSASEAAAMPIAYLTAYYALAKVARLDRGERVLIHSAAGGVGLAALQWAQHVGAEVYATAGNPEKREYLKSLGVQYVSDSRSDKFVEDVLRWSGGEGVDVVLNSLSGELIQKGFNLLRDHGRFVELGKRDSYANGQLGMRPFLKNLSFSLVDLRGMLRKHPQRVGKLFAELLELIVAGTFSPVPIEAESIARAGDAFRKMAQGKHIGKLVLTLSEAATPIRVPIQKTPIRKDGTYLITGGLGGLGLSVAAWLAEQGAGHLVLLGRSGAVGEEQQAAVRAIAGKRTLVTVARADVADAEQLASVLQGVKESEMPLRGVVHAAGVLEDGVLMKQTPEGLRRVLAPKAQGAWNLHRLTQRTELDFFVMYSSAAGLLGSPGQGNYAAANTFLDALAYRRKALGLPALSIDWGAFSEAGLAAAGERRGARLAARGMRNLKPVEGIRALSRLLQGSEVQIGVIPMDLRQWGAFHQQAASSPRLSQLRSGTQDRANKSQADQGLLARIATEKQAARPSLIAEVLRAQVAQVLRIPDGRVEVDAPLTSLGMDSLMGLELRNRIESLLGIRIPATLLWTYPTVASLSTHLASVVGGPAPPGAASSGSSSAVPEPPAATSVEDEGSLFAALKESLARAGKKVR